MKNRIIHVNLFDGGTIISRKIIILLVLFALTISIGHVSAMEDIACIDLEDSQMSEASSWEALSPSNSAFSDLSVSNEDSDLNSDSSEKLLSESESDDSSDDAPIVKNDTQIIIKKVEIKLPQSHELGFFINFNFFTHFISLLFFIAKLMQFFIQKAYKSMINFILF